MKLLADMLREHYGEITSYLYLGYARWDELVDRIARQERTSADAFADEQAWTFLVGCGYAVAAEEGVGLLTRILTGSDQREPTNAKIWFEVLPVPPRKKEGETHVDLALGTIARREGTESGIRLDHAESPWVCFCEMKWYSDIAAGVSYDVHRNQLARVIENAVCFQRAGKYADRLHVTLVTPSVFRRAPLKSRLYQYKMEEYTTNPTSLIQDLKGCILKKNDQPDWTYPPDLAQRVTKLSLRWATYDELFENLPDSAIATGLSDFWRQCGNYQGRGSGA